MKRLTEIRFGSWVWLILLAAFAGAGWAQEEGAGSGVRLRDLSAQNAVKLAAPEVQALASGASVQTPGARGLRTWKNAPDGKLLASASGTGLPRGGQGKGTWHVGDNGTYCVQIEWENRTEHWCRFIYRLGDKHYGVMSDSNPAAQALEMKFF
jgi:hypothetical protein